MAMVTINGVRYTVEYAKRKGLLREDDDQKPKTKIAPAPLNKARTAPNKEG